jgi:hypothetical protein
MDHAAGNPTAGAVVKETKIQPNQPVCVEFTWESEAEATGLLRTRGTNVLSLRGEPNVVKRALADALQRLSFEPPTSAMPLGYQHQGRAPR